MSSYNVSENVKGCGLWYVLCGLWSVVRAIVLVLLLSAVLIGAFVLSYLVVTAVLAWLAANLLAVGGITSAIAYVWSSYPG